MEAVNSTVYPQTGFYRRRISLSTGSSFSRPLQDRLLLPPTSPTSAQSPRPILLVTYCPSILVKPFLFIPAVGQMLLSSEKPSLTSPAEHDLALLWILKALTVCRLIAWHLG